MLVRLLLAGVVLAVSPRGAVDPGLIAPGPLAVARDGSLLIVDSGRNELFRRSPDGALHAVMSTTSDAITVGRDGSVYLADGGRVEVRAPTGALRTLAQRFGEVRSLAVAPDGTLYVGASRSVVALAGASRRTVVRGVGKFDQIVLGRQRYGAFTPDGIAVGANGDLYVYTFATKRIFEITPAGKPLRSWSAYAHGLAAAPDGSIVVGTQDGKLYRIRDGKMSTVFDFLARRTFGSPFQPDGVAVGPDGTIYTDTDVGNGYTDQTALAEVRPNGVPRLLRTTSSLAATLPAGYHASACPSPAGLGAFDATARKRAVVTAEVVDVVRFDRALELTDPSWWPGYYADQVDGRYDSGRHRVRSVGRASADRYSRALTRRCGAALVRDSLAIVVGPGVYSDQVSHMFFLDRNGRALLYWQHA